MTLATVMENRTAPSVAEQRTDVIPEQERLSGDSGQILLESLESRSQNIS